VTARLVGFAFPFRIAEAGGAATTPHTAGVVRAADDEKVRDDVAHLLGTRLGERLMARTYGAGVHRSVQEPSSSTLRALVKHEIEQALRIYMPDLRIVSPIELAGGEAELRVSFDYAADPRDVVRRIEVTVA
jgi:phage baseplate assembly protein W